MNSEFIQKYCINCGNCIPLLTNIGKGNCDPICYFHSDIPSYYQKIAILCRDMTTCPLGLDQEKAL